MTTALSVGPSAAAGPGATALGTTTDLTTLPGAAPAEGAAQPSGLSGIRANVERVLSQPAVKRALPLIAVLAVLMVFGLYYAWMQSTPYRAVMPGLMEADQQAAFEALKTANFKPQIDTSNGQLKVPADRFHEARMLLAAQGIPKQGTTGIEGLKDSTSMTTSQFMEQVRYNAAMEQELARSVLQIGSIQAARVHLATPKQSVFVRERVAPKASVVVSPYPGRSISPKQVQAIVHLVSSSVPYLTPEGVTVVDNMGKLLTESPLEGKLGLTTAQAMHKQQLEETYRERIMAILSPIVGETNVRSQVNLSLDFTQVESTTEDFDNREKGPRTRSEVLSEERNAAAKAEGVPGALSNRPPDNAAATTNTPAAAESTTQSSRSTRNYELDRTVRHVRNAMGQVERLSVAVVINEREPVAPPAGTPAPAAGAAPGAAPGAEGANAGYTPQEVERMLNLVRGVVGYDEKRGDVVTLIPAKFGPPPAMDTGAPWWQDSTVQSMIKSGLVALGFLVFLLVVARPVVKSMIKANEPLASEEEEKKILGDGELSEEDMKMIQIGEGETLEEIKAKLKPKKSAISAEMLDTANTYDDKVALIRMLVAEDSARVASVLKNMIKLG
ncbi:MAG: flagellar M-ring protein FliF [Betaproteobacteria bacterium]|nr:flagellar M-ring protein FliF [Betaproteobacteria bacterium]NBT10492.1 flagellar M-ring protein FliF [Betaproteobacteria bacterium]NBU50472.1 flagellar M-ring protein FliF [Betaproteobacteria bacterium]